MNDSQKNDPFPMMGMPGFLAAMIHKATKSKPEEKADKQEVKNDCAQNFEMPAPGPIMDRVKSFENACAIFKPSAELLQLASYSGTDPHMISAKNYAKLIIINGALNEGWVPDWSNTSERKWMPIFTDKPGFGLAFDAAGYWHSRTYVGSRLCLKEDALAKYSATQFPDVWNDYLTIKK